MIASLRGTAPISRLVVALVLFFIAFNFTVDGYWVLHARDLPARADTDLIARLFRSYAAADRGYYDKVSEAELALETVNSTLTQALTLLLLVALLRRWPARVPLQIGIGSSVCYSVLLDWWCAIVAGFPGMDQKTIGHFALFFGANLPWVLGHGFIAYDGIRAARAASNRRGPGTGSPADTDLPPSFPRARNLRQQARATSLSPDHWYAAAREKHVRRGSVLATRLQAEPVAVFRGADGALQAFEDRCRHRGVVLSVFPGDPLLADTTPMPKLPELEHRSRWACMPLQFEWHYRITLLTGAFMRRLLDRTADVETMPIFHPIFIRPVVAQHGDAVAWAQDGFTVHYARPPIELDPAVSMLQDLVVGKWREYLSNAGTAWRSGTPGDAR
jgi:Rieske [2Fe-2S] domain/EXPERA (EXPanded EBP superfamily)